MHRRLVYLAASAALTLAACGGGGGGSATPAGGGGVTPTQQPAAQGNLPLSENVAGSAAWVNPSSHKTLYFLDVDTATGGTCTQAANGCLSIWPAFVPSSGSTASQNMTIITRSDGTGQQWAYQAHPLYTYAGDNGPDQANGDNLPDFGGHWHVARPASNGGPTTGPSTPPCTGPYC